MEWQPIETLPESKVREGSTWPEGTRVLVWGKHLGVRDAEAFNWRGNRHVNVGNLNGDAIECWGVTHWMPLPAPPTPPAGEGRTG